MKLWIISCVFKIKDNHKSYHQYLWLKNVFNGIILVFGCHGKHGPHSTLSSEREGKNEQSPMWGHDLYSYIYGLGTIKREKLNRESKMANSLIIYKDSDIHVE